MKWVGRFLASAAAVVLSGTSGSATPAPVSTQIEEAWATATKKDSLEAYAAFIMVYPESPYAKSAYERLSGVKMPAHTEVGVIEPEAIVSEIKLFDFSSVAGKLRGWIV